MHLSPMCLQFQKWGGGRRPFPQPQTTHRLQVRNLCLKCWFWERRPAVRGAQRGCGTVQTQGHSGQVWERVRRRRTHLSTNRAGESGRVDSRSCMAFHSLMQLCSELMQLS